MLGIYPYSVTYPVYSVLPVPEPSTDLMEERDLLQRILDNLRRPYFGEAGNPELGRQPARDVFVIGHCR